MWLDLKGEWSRALGTQVKPSVGRLRLLLAVAILVHVALIFAVAVFLVSEVATISTHHACGQTPLIVFQQADQLLSQLQGQVLLSGGLNVVHHCCLHQLVQEDHQLIVNDHLADDGMHNGKRV